MNSFMNQWQKIIKPLITIINQLINKKNNYCSINYKQLYNNHKNFIKKSMEYKNIYNNSMIIKSLSNDYGLENNQENNYKSINNDGYSGYHNTNLNDLKDFLLHGTNKSYNVPHINDNTIILPNDMARDLIEKNANNSILNFIKTIYTDGNSIVIPIRHKKKDNCLWHKEGKVPDHNNEDNLEHKLINLGTLSTCPIVSRDFLFKNESVVQWLMGWINNDIYNEIAMSIFTKDHYSPVVENILTINKKRIQSITYEKKKINIIENLQNAINEVSGNYRSYSKFFLSRNFFNLLLKELLDFNHHFCNFILSDKTIFGYEYIVVEQLDGNQCIFGDLKSAYTLVIKNDNYLERDSLTKKNFVQFFFANSFGGSIVNEEAIFILQIDN